MDDDTAPWVPARPSALADSGRPASARRVAATHGAPSVSSSLGLPAQRPPRRTPAAPRRQHGRVAAAWSRISAARRILIAYLALATAIATVVGVGATLQPQYGGLSPLGGVAVDDVRTDPSQNSWAVDLADALAPGAPAECLRFSTVDVARGLVAVRAEGAWTYGFAADSVCTAVPDNYRARIALLDTTRGAIRWVHDTGDDLTMSDGTAITSVSTVGHDSRLLIRSGSSSESVVETLSTASGDVVSSTGAQPWTDDSRFAADGSVVALGRRDADGLGYRYELRDVDALASVVWSGEGNETATMIALDDRLLLGDEGTRQILLSTGVASRWGGPVNTGLGYAVRDGVVFAARTRGTGVTTTSAGGFSAVDRTGRVLWSSKLTLRGNYSLTRACLAVTDPAGHHLSCLAYRTGRELWSRDVGSFSYAGTATGQRSDDIYAVSTDGSPQVLALDGTTGRERFRADVPAGSYVVATGRTVGYVLAYGISGSRTSVIAFDLSNGRRLWMHASQLQVALWGGHLVDVGLDGVARRLTAGG